MLNRILVQQDAVASPAERNRFVESLRKAIQSRDVLSQEWNRTTDKKDILTLIRESFTAGDVDEAVWRAFLAAHFGRTSERDSQRAQSAAELLCAFGAKPFWTWKRLWKDPATFESWLRECADKLQTLAFGNHRKYESKKPKNLGPVVQSFLELAEQFGGPANLLAVPAGGDADGFDVLYRRFISLRRFGRTGAFDLLVLMSDLGMIDAKPRSSYLRGATGPLRGARLLWGKRPPAVLDGLACDLAFDLKVSPIVVEDALCNWQKDVPH